VRPLFASWLALDGVAHWCRVYEKLGCVRTTREPFRSVEGLTTRCIQQEGPVPPLFLSERWTPKAYSSPQRAFTAVFIWSVDRTEKKSRALQKRPAQMPDYYSRTIERTMLASPPFLVHKPLPICLSRCCPHRLLCGLIDVLSDMF